MTKFKEVAAAMRGFVHGVETEASSDFADACYELRAIDREDEDAPAEFAEFWLEVAAGKSDEYDPETGKRLFEV